MPPKPKAATSKAPTSTSKALVPVGDRHVATTAKRSKRDQNGHKPTTVRALVLRGSGEVMLASRLLGREKLDILLEDMIKEKAKGAVMSPFRIDTSLKIADSQCSSFLDDIAHLQDPVLFVPIIEAEWASRIPTKDPKAQEPLKSATAVAKTVATRIHNVYMLASAWKLVADTLQDMEDLGMNDDVDIKVQLLRDLDLRAKYLAVYHFLDHTLVKFLQERFSVLATTTPHFAQYFKIKELAEDDAPEEKCVFDYEALKAAGKSFIDSIILEICFPEGHYDPMLLMQLLHEGVDEAPKDSKRFPQALWDALGDLSDAVRLLSMLETPLLDPAFVQYKAAPADKLPGYDSWYDAMMLSLKATEEVTAFKDIIFPLAKAKKKPILDSMWKAINQMYKASTKKDIDTLWRLHEALNRTPQWHSIYVPGLKIDKDGKAEKKKVLAITEAGEDSDGSMPELQSVSNSSEEDESDDEESEEEEDDGNETSSEYDEEHEDEIRDLLRHAMDAAHEEDLFVKSDDDDEDVTKGNAFLKLLGSLRGRVFNTSPKLGGKKQPAPRNPKTGFFGKTKSGAPPKTPEQPTPAAKPKGKQAATVEEVEDEDDDKPSAPKKKKKKTKKKKKSAGAGASAEADGAEDDDEEAAPATTAATPAPAPAVPTSPTPASPAKKTPVAKSPAVAGLAAQMSTVSLGSTEATAQSAHSYLKSENLLDSKTKVKTHKPAADKKDGGFMSKFRKDKKPEETNKKPKHSLFSRLSKKATNSMHQLLRTSEDETKGLASMKWETFLKLMREMGFTYDPSTAGSSVRFDPPDSKDVSITFHKPHPDPTIHPIMLREFAKKLKKSYGWSEVDFLGSAAMA
ncbi:hypothetical protein C8F01DRAFT_1102364 [Mycena amicta]|nr:hypothetical protein C8F01DRAFT_1102364 [Mycena amicta]